MNKAYILTGGNTGNRELHLAKAMEEIDTRCGQVRKQSSLYETAAWGKTDQASFLNQAMLIHTKLAPETLLQCLLDIERSMGRIRNEKYGARSIDIDILIYNQQIVESATLSIPHPELTNRLFALLPLSEIAPRLKHPVFNKTIGQLLTLCPDKLPVRKIG